MQSLDLSQTGKWSFVNDRLIDFWKLLSMSNSCCAWDRLHSGAVLVWRREESAKRSWCRHSLSGRCSILMEVPPATTSPVHLAESSICPTDSHGDSTAAVCFFHPVFAWRCLLKHGLLFLNYPLVSWLISNLCVWMLLGSLSSV